MRKGIMLSLILLSALTVLVGQTKKTTFTIGVEDINYYPYYMTEAGNYIGFARELLDTFAKSKGYTFIYTPLPVNRLFKDLLSGALDFKFPDNSYWQSDLKKGIDVTYSASVIEYIDGTMVRPEDKGKGKSNIKMLGTVMGFTPYPWLDDLKANTIRLGENTSFILLVDQALMGRVDGIYANIKIVDYQLKIKKKPGALVYDPSLPFSKDSYYLSTTKNPEVIAEFNLFLKSSKSIIDGLKKKYGIE